MNVPPVLVVLALALTACTPEVQTPPQDVAAEVAAELIKNTPNLVVLDIRTPGEYAEGHIEGAKMIDFRAEDFAAELGKLDKDIPYLVHCRSGGRSGSAMPVFKELGFAKIYHLHKGFNSWVESGLPVSK